jgi:acetylornithine deacetylase/succinyl-diaminopimelate desuccinylase-like protein
MDLSAGFLDAARALIRADTVSIHGTWAAVDLLEPLYERAGLAVRRQILRLSIDGAPEADHVNVLAGPGGLGPGPSAGPSHGAISGGVLLVTHLDTVPPGPRERWTETGGDPWALTEKDGTLFGLGCADVKLDALCKAEAARRLKGRKLALPFWLLGTFGEEVGLRGARHFAESPLFAQEVKPRFVLCGEPSELQLICAHKGYAVVRCTVRDAKARLVSSSGPGIEELTFAGTAVHSSTPHLGVNAIHRALAWAQASGAPVLSVRGGAAANVVPASCVVQVPAPRERGEPAPDQMKLVPPTGLRPNLWRALATAGALEDLWKQLLAEQVPARDARFDPPGAVGGMNLIDSQAEESPADAVYGAGSIAVTFDARLLPEHDPDALLRQFETRAAAWVARLGKGELSLAISVERNATGMSLGEDSELVRRVSRTLAGRGLDATPRRKPTSTEAGVFARKGCEAIVLGPGRSTGNAHTANERIELAQLATAVDLYESLIVDLCGT